MLNTYQSNFAGLLLACGILWATSSRPRADRAKRGHHVGDQGSQPAFFIVYALVMGSDWLQGPFFYSLYRDEHGLSPQLIPHLFTTGFLSGALTAPFIGSLADLYGRRAACLFFCLVSAASCLLSTYPYVTLPFSRGQANQPSVPLLFTSRALGGLASSLLFSVFESWMVTDYKSRFPDADGGALSETFGTMSTVNSVVAIVSGVASEWLVEATGTTRSPFIASAAVLALAASFIWTHWDENYGSTGHALSSSTTTKVGKDEANLMQTLTSGRVLVLTLASTVFEGSMYLFVVLWAPVLQAASPQPSSLPYGLIFASFMSAALLSSLVYPALSRRISPLANLALVLLTASVSFLSLSTELSSEQAIFWLFCCFEAAVGAYFPALGVVKGAIVPDGVRSQVYAALRAPLNAFVVVSLLLMGEDTASIAVTVFGVCGAMLLGSVGAVWLVSL